MARDKDHPHGNAAGQGVSWGGTAGHDKVRQMKAVPRHFENFPEVLVTVGAGLFLPAFQSRKGDIRDCFGVGLGAFTMRASVRVRSKGGAFRTLLPHGLRQHWLNLGKHFDGLSRRKDEMIVQFTAFSDPRKQSVCHATMASWRRFISVVPLCDYCGAMPWQMTRYRKTPAMPVTIPTGSFRAASSGP